MAFPSRLRTVAAAVVGAALLLVVTKQITWDGWYAQHGAYRAQVDAFLDGRLALTEAPEGLAHDLAWTETGVQQVWGLGAPAWQTPFELVGRVIGATPFPDRVAVLAWLALAAYVLARGWRRGDGEGWWVSPGTIAICALLPGFVALVRTRIGVYEEAAIYAYGAAMMLLGGLAGFVREPSTRRYLALVAFAGVVGFIRPTVWFYGLATFVVASAVWVKHVPRAARVVALGTALFVAGGALLYASNARRFGAGTEFGHRLNVHSLPGNLYATRFSYPFEDVPVTTATLELAGGLFDRPEQRRGKRGDFYAEDLHVGQADEVRWREYYFTTYSWPYLPIVLAGIVLGVLAWRRRSTGDREMRWLGPWAVIGGAPLVLFYLWSPSLSSRYQLDLAPAIVALIVIAWRAFANRYRAAVALGVLAVLWVIAVATSMVWRPKAGTLPVDHATAAAATARLTSPATHARRLPGVYRLTDVLLPIYTDVITSFERCTDGQGVRVDCARPRRPGDMLVRGERDARGWRVTTVGDHGEAVETYPPALYLNGFGWDLETGRVPPSTYVYVDDVRTIEVDIAGDPAPRVRVAVGLQHLKQTALIRHGEVVTLRFEAPHVLRGVRVAFFAFGPDDALASPHAPFTLRAIRWQ